MKERFPYATGDRLEYGNLSGKPDCISTAHLECLLDGSILTEIGIRLISTDRPGHSLSDFQPDRKLLERFDPNSEIFPILEKEISDEEFETIIKDKYKDILQEMLRKAFIHSIDINNC